jgi:phage FluMu protein Com
MTSLTLQIRCVSCDGLLAEVSNVIDAGYAMIELACPTCGRSRLEIVGWLERAEAAG